MGCRARWADHGSNITGYCLGTDRDLSDRVDPAATWTWRRFGRRVGRHGRPERFWRQGRRRVHSHHDCRSDDLDFVVHAGAQVVCRGRSQPGLWAQPGRGGAAGPTKPTDSTGPCDGRRAGKNHGHDDRRCRTRVDASDFVNSGDCDNSGRAVEFYSYANGAGANHTGPQRTGAGKTFGRVNSQAVVGSRR